MKKYTVFFGDFFYEKTVYVFNQYPFNIFDIYYRPNYLTNGQTKKKHLYFLHLPKNVIKKSRVNNIYFLFELKEGVNFDIFLDLKTYYSVHIGILHSITFIMT